MITSSSWKTFEMHEKIFIGCDSDGTSHESREDAKRYLEAKYSNLLFKAAEKFTHVSRANAVELMNSFIVDNTAVELREIYDDIHKFERINLEYF